MAQTPQQEARAALTAMLEAHAHEAAALDAGAMRALVPILEQSRAELNRDLAAWLARGKGEDRYTVQAYRQSVLAIDAQLQVMQQHLAPALGGILVRHDAIARALANTHAAKEFLAFSTARTVELNPTVPLKIADVLANGRRAPMARYETSAARYAGQVATDIRRELAVGVVRGETNDQLVARLRALGGPRGSVAVRGVLGKPGAVVEVIPEGLFARYESWAERIVRTELAHAYTEQVQDIRNELVHDFPDMVRRWDATVDGRVCVRCGEMNGKDTDPKTDTFPGGVDVPLHPNCRCRAGLWRASWARFMDPNYVDPGAPRTATQPPPPMPARPVAPLQPPKPQPAPRKPRAPRAQPVATMPAVAPPTTPVAPPAPPPPPSTPGVVGIAPRPAPPMHLDASASVPAVPDLSSMTPAQRVAHMGINMEAVADAAAAIERTAAEFEKQAAIKAAFTPSAVGTPAEIAVSARTTAARVASVSAQETVRAFADRLVQQFGCAVHDSSMAARAWALSVENLARRRVNGYHKWDGFVAVDRKRHALMVKALRMFADGRAASITAEMWDTIRTLVHETVHGHSPRKAAAYVKHGAAIEEATTELAARNIMRRTFGTYGRGSYPDVIQRLQNASGCSMSTLEEASLRFHGPRPLDAPVSTTPDQHLRLFARWLVATRDGLATVPDAHNPQVDAMFNTLLPAMRKGP